MDTYWNSPFHVAVMYETFELAALDEQGVVNLHGAMAFNNLNFDTIDGPQLQMLHKRFFECFNPNGFLLARRG